MSYVFRYGALLFKDGRVANTYPVIKIIDVTIKVLTDANGYVLCIIIIYDGRICIESITIYTFMYGNGSSR